MAVDARRTETAGGLGFLRQLFAERPAAPATLDDPLGDATLLALRRHGIRPTPESFTLWYRHLAGERPDLSRRLKELEARGEPFDAGLIGVLHERYFGADQAALLVAEASRNALRLLARLESDLAGAEADAAARAERVGRLGRKLEGAPGEAKDGAASAASAEVHARHGEIRARVAELARETEGMRVAAGRLQRRGGRGRRRDHPASRGARGERGRRRGRSGERCRQAAAARARDAPSLRPKRPTGRSST
ncbi:MAG: hypothetical protein R3D28_06620 [Geminicoccaceae bacterium]